MNPSLKDMNRERERERERERVASQSLPRTNGPCAWGLLLDLYSYKVQQKRRWRRTNLLFIFYFFHLICFCLFVLLPQLRRVTQTSPHNNTIVVAIIVLHALSLSLSLSLARAHARAHSFAALKMSGFSQWLRPTKRAQVERTLATDWTSSANVDSALRHLIGLMDALDMHFWAFLMGPKINVVGMG